MPDDRREPPRRRARLVDVAAAADTSPPIASRILSRDPTLSVGVALRERVLAAANELQYRPSAAARGVRLGATGAIGMITPPLTNPVLLRIVRGAHSRAMARGVVVLIVEDTDEQQAYDAFTDLIHAGRIDGLLVMAARPEHPILPVLARQDVPHVFVNRAVADTGRNVILEEATACAIAIDHLIDLGHKHIGHLASPANLDPTVRRTRAVMERARVRGIPPIAIEHGETMERGGAEAGARLLARHPEITALFATSPGQAAGAMFAAWEMGLAIPQDLSVIAYIDTPLADVLIPPLTTVSMPVEELGAAGVDALLDQLAGAPPEDRVIPTRAELLIRASTGPPR